MSKWLTKFLKNKSQNSTDSTDITDRFNSNANMSVLSVPSEEPFCKNPGNISEMSTDSTDITDRFNSNANMSVLSVPSGRLFYKNLENISETSTDSTDITDRFNSTADMSGPSLRENFEERVAISEYDGQQTQLHAQRIAYLDAFMAVLSALPYEEEKGHYDEDWLTRRVKATRHWLAAQELQQPE